MKKIQNRDTFFQISMMSENLSLMFAHSTVFSVEHDK
jgi:hypothetical protein